MATYASGAAYIDSQGGLSAADPGFLDALGLPKEGAAAVLRDRAALEPGLQALLRGEGPKVARFSSPAAEGGEVEVVRCPGTGGALLIARTARLQERLEHGLRSLALSRLVAGVVHDIKNPLNAMSLQIAILGEKLGEASQAASPHLSALREQVGRVNEVLRRFLDVTDPSAPLGYAELGSLLRDLAALLSHEARRRQVGLSLDVPRAGVRTPCDPALASRLLLVLLSIALSTTPSAGRLEISLREEEGRAVLRVVHDRSDGGEGAAEDLEVWNAAVRGLGGEAIRAEEGGVSRLSLRLPGLERP